MKRIQIISGFTLTLLIAVCIYFFISLQRQQITEQKIIISKQINICGNKIEEYYLDFIDDVGYLAKFGSEPHADIISTENNQLLDRIKRLYMKYDNFISSVRVFDISGNMLIINKDSYNYFKIISVSNSSTRNVVSKPRVIVDNFKYKYNIPVYNEKGGIEGNISISVSIQNYFDKEFSNFYIGKNSWQFLINSDGYILKTRYSEKDISGDTILKITEKSKILSDINSGYEGFIENSIIFNQEPIELITTYYPVDILNNRFGLIFSADKSELLTPVRNKLIILLTSTFLIIGLIVLTFIILIRHQYKSETQVIQSLQTLNKVIENVPAGILIIDDNKILRKINQTASKMLNLKTKEKVLGEKYASCFSKEIVSIINSAKGKSNIKSSFINKKNEEVTLLTSSVSIVLEDDNFDIVTLYNISEIEKAIRAQQSANKAKSEFIANMSHEIRTPMNGIVGVTDLFSNTKLDDEQKELLSLLQYSAETMLHIINDILDFSKIEAGKLSIEKVPFDLFALMRSLGEQYSFLARQKNLKLAVNISPDLSHTFIGDPVRLQQILNNLLSNALKFTEKGEIIINVKKHSINNEEILLLFSVADTGIGIPKESLQSIFLSFTQVDNSSTTKYGGTGLGTTIAKQLTELMGGKIWVESPSEISPYQEFPGAVFYFTCKFFKA